MKKAPSFSHTLLMILVCLLPLFVFYMLAQFGIGVSSGFFWLFFLAGCLAMFYFMGGSPVQEDPIAEEEITEPEQPQYLTLAYKAEDVFKSRTQYKAGDNLVVEGRLLVDADSAYKKLKQRFADTDITPLLQEDDAGRALMILSPGALERRHEQSRSPVLNLVLLVLTLLTTIWAGAAHRGINLLEQPDQLVTGLPYALALMLILGAHELGHYFVARAHKIKVTLPYFIPVPFALGTFGAFIQMKSPVENRRALFDVGVAGPLAGLVFAIPALLIGLKYSTLVASTNTTEILKGGVSIGSSFLLTLLAKLSLGDILDTGHQVVLHPLAFAGWLGLLVTALNLLPIGQLDGGHIAHALFGRKNSNTIGMVALFSLVLLGLFVWSGLLTWAIIVFFIAGTKSAPPLNDITKLDTRRVAVGALAFVLLFLILIPVPHNFYSALGIHCPYI